MSFAKYIKDSITGIKSLFTGMGVTTSYFFRPWKVVTQKYPENRETLEMFNNFKGEIIMPHDENNQHKCTGCGICDINCPNGSINVVTMMIETEEGKKKKALDKHIYELSMCSLCGMCIKTCPSDALAYGNDFEHAVFDRSKLTKVLNNEGSTLKKGVK